MNENYLVTKSNTLITSSYDLSLQEQRIILTLASLVQPTDENFKSYEFSIKDFKELLGVEDKSKYTEIPKITKELMQKVLEIKQDKKIIQVAWLSSAEYEKGSGKIELEFSPKLKPYMLGLKEFYTSYRLKNVLELKGKYSIRMYEILKSNEFKKVAEIKVDELRKILKADTGSYLIYQNFKNRIIVQAKRELCSKTDICFDFEEIKTGRKVTALKFHIKSNNKDVNYMAAQIESEKEEKEEYIEKVKKVMYDHKITSLEAKKIYDSSNSNIELISKVYNHFKARKVENFIGTMISMVKPGIFQEPMNNTPKTHFNDYEQRQYDYTELEKKLLGWDKEELDRVGEKSKQSKIEAL
ncbi:replication initiation protein [Clostridium pasteurianum]|uniref:Protein involved in initiation of plasmid replication n=1 Tax=Clostridium pasteurianum BC1 TaxID=86416 RepID=R4KD21_CLOPA|nr:replication initiation protein [Clostridium pasteurianum]AGK99586.1 protein involved in initiation of plasmid replication [Clostridium pasteurianum BC1]